MDTMLDWLSGKAPYQIESEIECANNSGYWAPEGPGASAKRECGPESAGQIKGLQ